MQITVNGDPVDTQAKHLSDLIGQLGLAEKRIAVELNQHICPRSLWPQTTLNENDTLEIVHAIGGG